MRPFTAIFATLAVALPWYWAVGLATDGAFLEGFFWEHNVRRATEAMEGHRGGFLWFYPLAILIGFFPWTCFAMPLVLDTSAQVRRRDGAGAGYIFAICWVLVYVGLFSIARTKLPSYITPCYPALALLAGSYVDRWSRDAAAIARWWLPASFGVLALFGAIFAAAIPQVAERYLPGEEWLGMLGLTPLAGGVACIGLAFIRNYKAAAATFATSAVVFSTMLFSIGAQRADEHQTSHVILRTIQEHSADPQIGAYKILEPSWVFYAGRPIEVLAWKDGQEQAAEDLAEMNSWRVAEYLSQDPNRFVITTDEHLREISTRLPLEIAVLAETDLFLKEKRLIVLGHRSSPRLAGEPGVTAGQH
jgi:4-amino-4-deoxy-L-arabinose transferase-like glycosyltransferase